MSTLVFLDTETTGLSLDDDIWDIAMIERRPDQPDVEHQFYVEHDTSLAAALPPSFREDHARRYDPAIALSRFAAMGRVEEITRGAHIVGAVPNFDTERIARLMVHTGNTPAWHYHLIDVENLAVGFLHGRAFDTGETVPELPWDSNTLSARVGIVPPVEDRHTALGDVRWARDIYDAVTR